jgi:glutaredoxin
MIVDTLRAKLHLVITSPRGDTFAPLRVPKDLARRMNLALGSPLCSEGEVAKRRVAAEKLVALRNTRESAPRPREAAPVMIYFEKDRNARELTRMEELLNAKSIAFQKLDVASDEATLAFVVREAKCKDDELPVVFVGGHAVGGYAALVAADVSGELARYVAAG